MNAPQPERPVSFLRTFLHVVKWRITKFFADATAWRRPKARKLAHDYSMQVPFGYSPELPAMKIAAVCHIFHPHLAPEMLGYLKNIPAADLYVSTDTEVKAEEIRQVFQKWSKGQVEVRIAANRGRDVAPKMITFKDVYDLYDLLLFLHSKKTDHKGFGPEWRTLLMQNLLGSPAIVASVLECFAADAKLGILASQHGEPLRKYLNWGRNWGHATELARRMGFKLRALTFFDFPSGSMFWARPQALKPLLALNLALDDFPEEAGQIDGTIAHAIERLFFYACERAGYTWLKVASPEMFTYRDTILPIPNRQALEDFKTRRGVRLLPEAASSQTIDA